MLLDSNIIIYFTNFLNFSNFTTKYPQELFASKISLIEVLGYSNITDRYKLELNEIFKNLTLFEIEDRLINKAISLRQSKKIS
ncbi:MAG: hypothetical protein SFU98_04635 [Leptospiraceae bacterium]|nr:hypothetical protein [Leptospiraceae bacterium]